MTRIERCGCLKAGEGLGGAAQRGESEVAVGGAEGGREFHRLRESRQRFAGAAQRHECCSEIILGLGVAWLQFQRALEVGRRLRRAATRADG